MASRFDLSRIDRRWLFLVMAFAIGVPFLLRYIPFIKPSSTSERFYAAIADLEPGSVVLVSCDYDPGSEAEIYPMNLALFRQLRGMDVKIVITQLWPQAGPLVEKALKDSKYFEKKDYGKDLVNLGFKTGNQVLISKMVESIPSAFPEDVNGTPTREVPVMKGIENFSDIDLFVILSAGTPGTKEWVQQCQSRTGKPMVSGVTAVSAPDFFAYLNSGQLVGLLSGLRGAADYETLVGTPERGVEGMGPQTFGHFLIVLFIILGNIGYFIARRREREA